MEKIPTRSRSQPKTDRLHNIGPKTVQKRLSFSPCVAAIPPEQESFLQEVQEKVERFVESEALSLELSRCNAFQRRLIYQTTRDKYPGLRQIQTSLFLTLILVWCSLGVTAHRGGNNSITGSNPNILPKSCLSKIQHLRAEMVASQAYVRSVLVPEWFIQDPATSSEIGSG